MLKYTVQIEYNNDNVAFHYFNDLEEAKKYASDCLATFGVRYADVLVVAPGYEDKDIKILQRI